MQQRIPLYKICMLLLILNMDERKNINDYVIISKHYDFSGLVKMTIKSHSWMESVKYSTSSDK